MTHPSLLTTPLPAKPVPLPSRPRALGDFRYGRVAVNRAGRSEVALGAVLETVHGGVNGEHVEGWDAGRWAATILDILFRTWSPDASYLATTRFHGERHLLEWVESAETSGG